MTTLAPEDPQRRQEEQAANLLKDLFGSKIDALVRGGVKVSVITKPETVIQDIVDRLGVTKSPWADIVGPCYTSGSLQRELGVERGAVSRAVKEFRALRLPTADGRNLYPAFQVRNRQLVPGLKEVLTVLQSGIDDPWTWAQWLNIPLADENGEDQPRAIDLLANGDLETVLVEARHDAAAWAA